LKVFSVRDHHQAKRFSSENFLFGRMGIGRVRIRCRLDLCQARMERDGSRM